MTRIAPSCVAPFASQPSPLASATTASGDVFHNRPISSFKTSFKSSAARPGPNNAAEAFAAIGIDRYHVLGTSFGGGIALHLALAHPDRVISLVLEAPAAFREGATSPADIPPEDMVRRFRVHPERVPAFTPPDPAVMARTWPLVERLLASRPEFDSELADRLPEVSIRTLVLFGDRDGIVPAENGRTYRRLMPNCSYVLVHDAAHDIQGDRPEAFADVAGDFLARGWQFLLPEQSTLINP